MIPRERTLAVALLGFILLGGGGALGYMMVLQPLDDKKAAAQRLDSEVSDLERKLGDMARARPQVLEAKRQSLPPDQNSAKTRYKLLLERLLRKCGITDYTIPDGRVLDNRTPVTPELAPKKPAYARLEFRIDLNKVDAWQLADFLAGYYQVDLLHQITELRISRENKPTDPRNGLKVHITSEALVLDGAEPREGLLAVNPQLAAVAGMPAEAASRVTLHRLSGVLASRGRDYSFLARNDIFYGPVPVTPDKPPVPLTMDRLWDVEVKKAGEKPKEVKVSLKGDGAAEAKITAKVTGKLLPEGEYPIDPKTHTLTLPATKEDAELTAKSNVKVVAVGPDGKETGRDFDVAIAEAESGALKDDIAKVIRLTILSGNSDGVATALVYDAANPYRYEVTAGPKGVSIAKLHLTKDKQKKDKWEEVENYKHGPGELVISDDSTSTKRALKVVALEDGGMIVADGGKVPARPEPPKGARPGGGGNPRQRSGGAVGAVAGNLGVFLANLPPVVPAVAAAAGPTPTLYRWPLGKSLHELKEIPVDEAKKILERTAAVGPLLTIAATGEGEN